MVGADKESKYNHLLQPIRDLATNWNIDIAHDLEEYLDQLETVSIEFDTDNVENDGYIGSQSGLQLNFAEAALLIQGTTCIYSRKVEYLYALVYQTLDHLMQRSSNTGTQGSSSQENPQGDQMDVDSEPESSDAPLALITNLSRGKSIDLNDKRNPKGKYSREKDHATNFQASIALMGSLVPDEYDHGDVFKITTCVMDSSGMLLLDANSVCPAGSEAKKQADLFETHSMDPGGDDDFAPDICDDVSDNNEPIYEATSGYMSDVDQQLTTPVKSSETFEETDTGVALLDPFDTSANKVQPYRKGNTTQSKKWIEKKLLQLTGENRQDLMGFLDNTTDVQNCKIPMSGPLCEEFRHFYDRKKQFEQKIRREDKKREQSLGSRNIVHPEAIDDSDSDVNDYPDMYDQDDGDMGGSFDDDNDMTATYHDQPSSDTAPLIAMNLAFDDITSHGYEDLCRLHINAFMSGAEKFTKETNLSRKVDDWRSKLDPILEEESQHPRFDIHSCGKEIVNKLQEKDGDEEEDASSEPTPIDFHNVVRGKPVFEVCRMFLASLQLANTGNVELHHGIASEEQIKTPFSMLLLTSRNQFASIQTPNEELKSAGFQTTK